MNDLDLFLGLLPTWIVIVVFTIFLRMTWRHDISLMPVLLAALIGITNMAIVVYGGEMEAVLNFRLNWNWSGKLASIIFGFALIALLPQLNTNNVGLTWKQKTGSIKPALIALGLLCCLAFAMTALQSTPSLDPESLLYEATLPGIAEELLGRGIFLTLLLQGFNDRQQLFGATIGPSVWLVAFNFGAGHGIQYYDHEFQISPNNFVITGFVGFGLAWIRQRTGSLLLPIITHNVFNLILFIGLPV